MTGVLLKVWNPNRRKDNMERLAPKVCGIWLSFWNHGRRFFEWGASVKQRWVAFLFVMIMTRDERDHRKTTPMSA